MPEHKKTPAAKLFGEPSRLFQMYDIANVWICFEYAKEKAEFFNNSASNQYASAAYG
ncbi:hypothetical protein [uncultured Bacteroides sp.]|uniref:hypothetical protein n=1 Tax=uncultured Bacteroides sp. TaxID=162156 RepID=UPI002592E2DA|nr:hypothetical protein [uncultured Bacteroides sp.]